MGNNYFKNDLLFNFSGERPFQCSFAGCQMRFTHANRHCPDHPYDVLKRCEDEFMMSSQPEEQSTEILKWLQKYREDRQHLLQQQTMSPSPSTSRKTPKRALSSTKSNDENKKRVFNRSVASTPSGILAQENCDTPINEMLAMSPSKAARKGLMCVMDMNAGIGSMQNSTPVQITSSISDISELASMGSPISNKPKQCRPKVILWKEPIDDGDDDLFESSGSREFSVTSPPTLKQETAISSPVKKSFNPKKKWLRECAWQEDLGAKPLDGYGSTHPLYKSQSQCDTNNWQMASSNDSASTSGDNINPNQNRPSVLIMGPNIIHQTLSRIERTINKSDQPCEL